MATTQVVIDSSVLVALINPRDHWRNHATALHRALQVDGADLLYLDCIIDESLSVVVRRLYEQRHDDEVEQLFAQLDSYAPTAHITWVLPDVPRLYMDIIDLMRSSSGTLNFHDALIALSCRERDILAIASFDADFDQIPWLRRLSSAEDVAQL
jgi:predicted nucleic acid-binding protein